MFRVLPRNKELDELWREGLVYSRNKDYTDDTDWRFDSPDQITPPTESMQRWEFAIHVEE